ncbi:MAG: hypothetical protein NVSMB45_12820 [Ginsengibacter sp.]
MEQMIDLSDLLKHEIMDLYSVESQIIDALPNMIEKALNPSLKKALKSQAIMRKIQVIVNRDFLQDYLTEVLKKSVWVWKGY